MRRENGEDMQWRFVCFGLVERESLRKAGGEVAVCACLCVCACGLPFFAAARTPLAPLENVHPMNKRN